MGILILASGVELLAVILVHTAIWILRATYSVYLAFSTGLTIRARYRIIRTLVGLQRDLTCPP